MEIVIILLLVWGIGQFFYTIFWYYQREQKKKNKGLVFKKNSKNYPLTEKELEFL